VGVSSFREMLRLRKTREEVYSRKEYWDAKAEEYEGDAVSMWPNNRLNRFYHREQIAAMEQMLPDVSGLRVLDVGCGTGRTSRYLAERGASVVGVDFSARAIEIARERSPGSNPSYRVQSVFDLNDSGVFDLALSWGVVTVACRSREELHDVLRRIAGALRPGGKLLVCEPIHKGFLHRVLNLELVEFCAVMSEAGFSVEKVRHLHFWPMRLMLAFVAWPKPLTAAGYYLGRGIMALCGDKAFGDYKVIAAELRGSGRQG